jgi:methylated-DNA-[protein]-cysteine S-methyltransferase
MKPAPDVRNRRGETSSGTGSRTATSPPWPDDAHHASMASPVGRLDVVTDGRGRLLAVVFEADAASVGKLPPAASLAAPALAQLDEYFAGRRRSFDLELAPAGTSFQQRVWRALREIPYGTTCSYGELARRVGGTAHPRAIGSANGRNPISIVIPCHRVIGADGRLTGYGGGLPRKRKLLALEGAGWRE